LVREDDRHANADRDSDRPLWQVDRPLCEIGLPYQPLVSKDDESDNVTRQVTAVKTRQQVRAEREEAAKPEDHNHRALAGMAVIWIDRCRHATPTGPFGRTTGHFVQ